MKFEGIPETFASSAEDGAIQRGEVSTENTKVVLTDFLERVLGIEDAQNIEYQRVHRERKMEEKGSLLRVSESFQTENGCSNADVNSRKQDTRCMKTSRNKSMRIEKLKNARKDGKRAYFSRLEPSKLYINGKYVKM